MRNDNMINLISKIITWWKYSIDVLKFWRHIGIKLWHPWIKIWFNAMNLNKNPILFITLFYNIYIVVPIPQYPNLNITKLNHNQYNNRITNPQIVIKKQIGLSNKSKVRKPIHPHIHYTCNMLLNITITSIKTKIQR